MGPEYSEMIQKNENTINNSLIVGDSYAEKSSNGDNSIFSQDEDHLDNSHRSSEDPSSSSSEDQLSDTSVGDVKYYVTAGRSPLSVVIKRCNNLATLSEDSSSNNVDNACESSRSSRLESARQINSVKLDPDSENRLDKDLNTIKSTSQSSGDCLNQTLSRKPCTVTEYVETIKSLVGMGLSVSESDQCGGPPVLSEGSRSLVEILQGSQNTEDQSDNVDGEEKDSCFQKCYQPFQRERMEDVAWNTDSESISLPVRTEFSVNQLSPNDRVELSICSSPLSISDLSLNTNKSSYVVTDRSSHAQSTSTVTAQQSEVETRNFIFEDSCSSPKSVYISSETDSILFQAPHILSRETTVSKSESVTFDSQLEAADSFQSETENFQFQAPNILCNEDTILKSDCETFDSQLETTSSFDNTSLIDVGLDRIVYSPTLFSDDEDAENSSSCVQGVQKKSPSDIHCRRSRTTEARRLKQLQISMNGLPPPPSVTNPQLSVSDILRSLEENKAAMAWSGSSPEGKERRAKLLNDAKESVWPDAASFCYPDMHYNNGLRSEQFALLSQKFVQRYVGAETACFCNVAGTTGSARKRNKKLGVAFSPGRRLSHLARRRKAFSRDNLLSATAGSVPKSQPNTLSERRQIVIDPKTKPKPNKPVIPKPSLSFKAVISGPRVLSHKRALFQSPDEGKKVASAKKSQSGSKRMNALRTGVESFKRALFGSASKDKELPEVKRSRNDETHLVASSSSSKRKLFFDNVEGPSKRPMSQLSSSSNGNLNHPGSSSTTKTDSKSSLLNSGHKKKLLWAVAESLRKKGITMSHALFRPCASSLARVCRSVLPDLQRHNGSTSELMLEIADKYASDIVREKSSLVNTL